ncbi:MAG TPA: TonB family protein [Puia sp.]|nr:TonB family protein [Puia sp.]
MKTSKSGRDTEIFYINKSNYSREGSYTLTGWKGKVLVTGFYSSGQKDSVWIFFGTGGIINEKHYYKKGVRTGTWEYYKDGELIWTYNFDSSKANYFVPEDTDKEAKPYVAWQDGNGNWIHTTPEKHAILINDDYLYVAQANLEYPIEAQDKEQQGQVMIAVLVDQMGNPESFDVGVSSGYPSLDKEALRVMKLTHFEFIPAENKNVKVKSIYQRAVNFRMEVH